MISIALGDDQVSYVVFWVKIFPPIGEVISATSATASNSDIIVWLVNLCYLTVLQSHQYKQLPEVSIFLGHRAISLIISTQSSISESVSLLSSSAKVLTMRDTMFDLARTLYKATTTANAREFDAISRYYVS